jgi:RNA polymerase sigma-70 factor (ECF subfamily)
MAVVTASAPRELVVNDEQLLRHSQSGNRSALEELFRRHREVAFRVAFRLLGHEADALDAVQEAFIKVFTHLDGFEGRSSFKTWLLRVVCNASLDLGRQRGRRESLHCDDLQADSQCDVAAMHEPGRDLESADLRRLLNEALAQLPEAQRRTFVLHVDGEMSYREVADVLGISIGTVMSRLFYARQKLRNLLAEKWPT